MDIEREARQAGVLLLGGTAGSLVLMLHHPTSLHGPDDGLLLGDWSNAGVHGGMIVCLLAIALAGPALSRRLGEAHLSVRAGGLLFGAGMAAFIGAALVNGFAPDVLAARTDSRDVLTMQVGTLAALNQTLAAFGMVSTAAALALWAARLLRLDALGRVVGVAGLAIAGLAAGWLALGGGAFGLVPAVVATLVFGAWSALAAAWLLRGASQRHGSEQDAGQ